MEPITSALFSAPPTRTTGGKAFAELGSQEFLSLLTAELTNQDPFEPTDNAALLEQLSSIRNMELSTTLIDSLRKLTDQQQFGAASSLIGKNVTSVANESGQTISGMVTAIQFQADGQVVLRLSNGEALALTQVSLIELPLQAAEKLVGRVVAGVDRRTPDEPEAVEGLVTAVRLDEQGEVVLELDSGVDLRLRDVIASAAQ